MGEVYYKIWISNMFDIVLLQSNNVFRQLRIIFKCNIYVITTYKRRSWNCVKLVWYGMDNAKLISDAVQISFSLSFQTSKKSATSLHNAYICLKIRNVFAGFVLFFTSDQCVLLSAVTRNFPLLRLGRGICGSFDILYTNINICVKPLKVDRSLVWLYSVLKLYAKTCRLQKKMFVMQYKLTTALIVGYVIFHTRYNRHWTTF